MWWPAAKHSYSCLVPPQWDGGKGRKRKRAWQLTVQDKDSLQHEWKRKKKKKAMQRQYLSTFHKQTDEAQPITLSPPAVLEDKNPFFFWFFFFFIWLSVTLWICLWSSVLAVSSWPLATPDYSFWGQIWKDLDALQAVLSNSQNTGASSALF